MKASTPLETIGLLGGGVIGGGWAARFVLNGYDVKIYDVDPQAQRKIGEVMANARRAYAKLTLAPLPREGTITFVDTPEQADGRRLRSRECARTCRIKTRVVGKGKQSRPRPRRIRLFNIWDIANSVATRHDFS